MNATDNEPLLTPSNVTLLSENLARLAQRLSHIDRIERCGLECGDLRATLTALASQIQQMLTILGNVPPGAVPQFGGGGPRPMLPTMQQ